MAPPPSRSIWEDFYTKVTAMTASPNHAELNLMITTTARDTIPMAPTPEVRVQPTSDVNRIEMTAEMATNSLIGLSALSDRYIGQA